MTDERVLFRPTKLVSRLQALAEVEGILTIPEGTSQIQVGYRQSAFNRHPVISSRLHGWTEILDVQPVSGTPLIT